MADLISQQGLYQDGNSIFENVHILGTLNVTGIVNTETTVKASKFIGDGSELTGIDATTIKDSAGTIRIQGTTTGATHSGRAVFTEVEITGKLYDGVTGEMGSAGKVLSSTGSQLEWINTSAANVGSATNVGVNLDSTDASQFVSFVGANSGNQPTRVNNSFRYNPSSNTIATIKINDLQVVGQLKDGEGNFGASGTVLTSDGTDTAWENVGTLAAGSAAKLSVSEDDTETDGRLLFSNAAGQSGGNVIKSDNDLTYNANTNTLTVTNLSGTATQAANLSNHDTDDLSEGSSNLYFTNGRARAAISVGAEGSPSGDGSISYNNSTGVLTFTPAAAAGTPTAITVADESSDTTCFPLFATAATGDLAPKTGSNLTFNSSDGTLTANNFSGDGANLSNLNAGNLSSGSLPSARLSGTYANTVTIGTVRIGAWTGGSSYKGIFHANQTGSEYMIMTNDGHTFISATTGNSVYIRYGNNDSTNQLIIGSGNDALTWRGNKVFHAGNDGSGSGLDADTVDGIQGASFLRSDASDTMSGLLTLNNNANRVIVLDRNIASPANYYNDLQMEIRATSGTAGIGFHRSGYSHVGIYHDASGSVKFNMNNGTATLNGTTGTVWGSGNDGSGSGLDADLLDGQHGSHYSNYNNLSNRPTIPTNNNQLTNGRGFITGVNSAAAKSGFAHNFGTVSYSGNSYAGGNFGTHISCSLTPSSSNSRVVVMASFQIRRLGNQNNNVYARARLTGGGDLQEKEIVRTNQISFVDSFNQFKLIAYDAAGNTSNRTYNLAVNYTTGSGSTGVQIRHASIVAIELRS